MTSQSLVQVKSRPCFARPYPGILTYSYYSPSYYLDKTEPDNQNTKGWGDGSHPDSE